MSEDRSRIASRMAGQSGLLMLGNMFTLFVGFPFQIYLAKTLGADQLGALGLFEVIAQTAGTVFGFGLATTLVRFIPHHLALQDGGSIRTLLKSVYTLTLISGILGAVLLMAGNTYFLQWIPELRAYSSLFPFVGIMMLLGMLIGLSAQALRAFLDIRYMILIASFLQLAVKVVLTMLLFWLGWRLSGYLLAVVVSVGVALAGMLWGIHRHFKQLQPVHDNVALETRQGWWSFARTMYANSLLGIAAPPAERLLLASTVDLASVGVLMAIRQLQSFPQIIFQILVAVISPMIVAAKARGDMDEVKHLYHISTDWMCRLGFPLLIFLLIFGGELLRLYGSTFSVVGFWPLVILVTGSMFNLLTGPHGAMLNMLGYEKDMFKLYLMSSVLFFAGLFLMAPKLGLVGVALAGLLPNIILNFFELYVMKKWLGIGWWSDRYMRLIKPMIFTIFSALIINFFFSVFNAWVLVCILFFMYVVFCCAYLIGGLSKEDVEIGKMIRSQIKFR